MSRTDTLTLPELDAQGVELVPRRETLLLDVNVAPVVGVNVAIAVNAATIGSTAQAFALQTILVSQG
ncbi:MAG: hypothetical protein ACLGIV_12410 [Actinomycetes bacterium]